MRTVGRLQRCRCAGAARRACDEAHRIGPPPPRESYLERRRDPRRVAKRTGAQAIHPGYGFLSENEAFARGVRRAGSSSSARRPRRSPRWARSRRRRRSWTRPACRSCPAITATISDAALLAREAERIGYPGADQGDGGRRRQGHAGRRARRASSPRRSRRRSARRRRRSATTRVLLERYLDARRATSRSRSSPTRTATSCTCSSASARCSGAIRRCSRKRRRRGMTTARRARDGRRGGRAAKAIGYVGAGTVEFIAEQDGAFYFMEMNTRLQVEHPVTEMITGLDLVEWQLRVARRRAAAARAAGAGDRRPRDRGAHLRRGSRRAASCRRPARIAHWRMPEATRARARRHRLSRGRQGQPVLRPDAREGDRVGRRSRARRAQALLRALSQCEVTGVATNVAFLERVVAHAAFASGRSTRA